MNIFKLLSIVCFCLPAPPSLSIRQFEDIELANAESETPNSFCLFLRANLNNSNCLVQADKEACQHI